MRNLLLIFITIMTMSCTPDIMDIPETRTEYTYTLTSRMDSTVTTTSSLGVGSLYKSYLTYNQAYFFTDKDRRDMITQKDYYYDGRQIVYYLHPYVPITEGYIIIEEFVTHDKSEADMWSSERSYNTRSINPYRVYEGFVFVDYTYTVSTITTSRIVQL